MKCPYCHKAGFVRLKGHIAKAHSSQEKAKAPISEPLILPAPQPPTISQLFDAAEASIAAARAALNEASKALQEQLK